MIVLTLAMLSLVATAADAHARLLISIPVAGVTLKTGPREIRLNFSESLELVFSGLELRDRHGKLVPTGTAMLDPSADNQLVVPIGTHLAPGTYSVAWHAVGKDTNRVSGKFTFRVKQQ